MCLLIPYPNIVYGSMGKMCTIVNVTCYNWRTLNIMMSGMLNIIETEIIFETGKLYLIESAPVCIV